MSRPMLSEDTYGMIEAIEDLREDVCEFKNAWIEARAAAHPFVGKVLEIYITKDHAELQMPVWLREVAPGADGYEWWLIQGMNHGTYRAPGFHESIWISTHIVAHVTSVQEYDHRHNGGVPV